MKKTVGIYPFTCCEGCQLQILDLWDKLVEVLEFIDIKHFRMAQEMNVEEKHDIAIVEGAISTRKEIEDLKRIRKNSGILVAIGECAVTGGIPAIRNDGKGGKGMLKKTTGIGEHVKVDCNIRGCPIDKGEFLRVITGLAVGRMPYDVNEPVCMECNNKEIDCLLLKGIPCMGPVTCAGCGALCPSVGTGCEGCRGMTEDAGLKQLKDRLEEIGIDRKMIRNMMERFSKEVKHDKHKD